MECTFNDLLSQAINSGAVDRWKEDGTLYEFTMGSRIFRMRPGDCQAFLEATLNRHQLEVIRRYTPFKPG